MRKHIISLVVYWILAIAFVKAQNQNWVSFPQGQEVNGDIHFLGEYKGKLIAGGKFTQVGNVLTNCVAAWDGMQWSNFGRGVHAYSQMGTPRPSYVTRAIEYNNELYVIGLFDSAGNVAAKHIARWDGNNWHSLSDEPNHHISGVIVYKNSLYITGNFDSIGNIPVNGIARWDGSAWHSLPNSLIYSSLGMFVEYNEELLLLGGIEDLDDSIVDGIVKWDGVKWLVFPLGLNYDGNIPVVWNNKLIVGYRSKLFNGEPSTIIKQWDGNNWSNFSVSSGGKSAGYLYTHNQKLYSCGLSKNNTDTVTNVWEWDTINSTWQDIGSGVNSTTFVVCAHNGELYCGGKFSKEKTGAKHNYLARYTTTTGLQTKEIKTNNITIYPNPNNGSFTLNLPNTKQPVTCIIMDLTGRVVYTKNQLNLTTGKITIENTGLNPGVYFCQVVVGDVLVNQKIVLAN